MRKRLTSLLGAAVFGVAAMLPGEMNGQQLRIANYTTSFGNQNVAYIANGADSKYTSTANAFQIYDIDSLGNTNKARSVNTSTGGLFKIFLAYKGTIADGITNKQRVAFLKEDGATKVLGSSFLGNIVITYKVIDKTGTRVFDLAKECAAMSNTNTPFEIQMPTTSNALPGTYSTNYLSFATKESSTPTIESLDLDGRQSNATVTVNNVLPGENVVLESTEDLSNPIDWSPIATNYVAVTSQNFGTTDSTIFGNVKAMKKEKEFFRARVQ